MLGGAALSYVIPQALDPAWTAFLDRAAQPLLAGPMARLAAKMARALPPGVGRDFRREAGEHWRMRLEDAWGRARGVRRLGWRPQVRIAGLERLDAALARGRGAVLWCTRTASSTAIKQAFYYAGRPLVHLSRAQHGSPTETRLGLGVAAPLYCRAENPYLRERIVIPLDGATGYMRTLQRRLRENSCISIFGEHAGRQNVVCRVLTARLTFAIGAPSLAWSEEAALLTVNVRREGPFAYCVDIGEEIPVDRSVPRKAFAEHAIRSFAQRLETAVLAKPSDWQGWSYYEFPDRRET